MMTLHQVLQKTKTKWLRMSTLGAMSWPARNKASKFFVLLYMLAINKEKY